MRLKGGKSLSSEKIKITRKEIDDLYDITDEKEEIKKLVRDEWEVTIEDGDKKLEEDLD